MKIFLDWTKSYKKFDPSNELITITMTSQIQQAKTWASAGQTYAAVSLGSSLEKIL